MVSLEGKTLREVSSFVSQKLSTLENVISTTTHFVLKKYKDHGTILNGEKTDDPQVLREGMLLIYQKLMKALEAQGVSKIDTEDADFDTNLHEAVALVPGMGDDKKGKVIDCMATGYKLNEKVIRYAKVAVGQ